MSDEATVRAGRFAVLVCEVRPDGLWPVIRYADPRRASVMKAPPMAIEGPAKTTPIALPAVKRFLEGLLDSEYRVAVRAILRELAEENDISES